MILEYLFTDKKNRIEIQNYIASVEEHRTIKNDIRCTYKDFDNVEYWALRCEISTNKKENAVFLSHINTRICQFSPIVLTNESAEYFNKNLFPHVNKFERLLRKYLFLKIVQYDEEKFNFILKGLEKMDFGQIYSVLFIDAKFRTSAHNEIKNVSTRAEMLEILNNLQENTTWDILVEPNSLNIIKDNFESLKTYRNDVMHAHNIGHDIFENAKKLFEESNKQLEVEICKIIEFEQPAEPPAEYKDSLYEKLFYASQGIAKLGNATITAFEKIAQFSNTITPEKLETLRKLILLFAETDNIQPTDDDCDPDNTIEETEDTNNK